MIIMIMITIIMIKISLLSLPASSWRYNNCRYEMHYARDALASVRPPPACSTHLVTGPRRLSAPYEDELEVGEDATLRFAQMYVLFWEY